jgi:putative sterol carrier protein
MSVEFGTLQVYEEMAKLLNGDPVWLQKGKAITYTMVFAYNEPVSKAFFVRFDCGSVTEVRELPSPDAEPADFVISGDPDIWRGVFAKQISPAAAMTKGQLKVKGRLTTLLKHMSAFSYVIDAMTSIELV